MATRVSAAAGPALCSKYVYCIRTYLYIIRINDVCMYTHAPYAHIYRAHGACSVLR